METFLEIETLCREHFGGKGKLTGYETLSGGAVNKTYKIYWNETPYVFKMYIRDPEVTDVYSLIRESVPCIPPLYLSMKSPPFALFPYCEGRPIFEIKDPKLISRVSYALGETLSTIHAFSFPQAGLFGEGLSIQLSFPEGSRPYYTYIEEHFLEASPAWKHMGQQRAERVRAFLKEHEALFPKVEGGGVLVHADFKPVNLLWSEAEGVTVLDWEFAHVGDPLIDFGILIRHEDEFPLDFQEFEKGYSGVLPPDWVWRARLTDFVNLIQLLNRPTQSASMRAFLLSRVDRVVRDGKKSSQ